jgi:hypothetical protein
MNKISIKAAYLDTINRIIFYTNRKNDNIKETSIDPNDISKDELIDILQKCISYNFIEDELVYTIKKSVGEIRLQEITDKNIVTSSVNQLKKWMLNEAANIEILEYLKFMKLNWIIDLLK